jgi:hypothetical protein
MRHLALVLDHDVDSVAEDLRDDRLAESVLLKIVEDRPAGLAPRVCSARSHLRELSEQNKELAPHSLGSTSAALMIELSRRSTLTCHQRLAEASERAK